jgi:hypothetical protein
MGPTFKALERMGIKRVPKEALKYTPKGKRSIGLPRKIGRAT